MYTHAAEANVLEITSFRESLKASLLGDTTAVVLEELLEELLINKKNADTIGLNFCNNKEICAVCFIDGRKP